MNPEFRKKSTARLYATQAIYLCTMRPQTSLDRALEACVSAPEAEAISGNMEFAFQIVQCWDKERERIHALINQVSTQRWQVNRMDTVLSAIVQAGIAECIAIPESDIALIIGEYVDVGHAFFQDSEHKIIHGILHAATSLLRARTPLACDSDE